MNPEITEQELKSDRYRLDDLNLACRQGDIQTMSSILSKHPEWLNIHVSSVTQKQKFFPPLNHTVISGQLEAALWLIQQGADPNLINYIGETSLHQAADNEQYDIAKLLLENGADPNIKQKDGETPIHNAIFRNDLDMLNLLLKHRANPNIPNLYVGRTPIHYAVDNNNLEAVELLISHGAEPEFQDIEGTTPMDLASEEMKKLIRKHIGKGRSISLGVLNFLPENREDERLSIFNAGGLNIQPEMTFVIKFDSDWSESTPGEILRDDIFSDVSRVQYSEITIEPDAELSIYKKDHSLLREWLARIHLECMYDIFLEGGLDDLESLVTQMKSPLPIDDEMLMIAGITKPGHRVRILMKLDEDARLALNKGMHSVTHSTYDTNWKCCATNKKLMINSVQMTESIVDLEYWLKSMKLEHLYPKFFNSGYDNLDMLKKQLLSRYPITDEILKNEIGIVKAGHRFRILSKLHEELKQNLSDTVIKMEGQEANRSCASCDLF